MHYQITERMFVGVFIIFLMSNLPAQQSVMLKLPDTGQTGDYTSTFGEDSDYLINSPSLIDNNDGTLTDKITGLMWQKTDGGEMIFENAAVYCENLVLGGYSDWRLPTIHELYTILHHGSNHPALDTTKFTKTLAEYWWSSDKQIDDTLKIWVTNAGGGCGAHLKSETISAGGSRRIHVLAVRNVSASTRLSARFVNNNDGSVTDLRSGLIWQRVPQTTAMTWESALSYCENLSLAGYSDWRLPNIKELHSLNDELKKNPSVDSAFIAGIGVKNYWSSTTLLGQTTRAWYMSTGYGLVTYDDKTKLMYVICVRGSSMKRLFYPEVSLLNGGEFVMGDHHGYVDPQHPSDELPLHTVKVDSFYIGRYTITNLQYCDYLNSAKLAGSIEVRNNLVYAAGDTNVYCYTNQYASYSSISWNGSEFSVIDFRASHPIVGVMWFGAAAYCNWLSIQTGLQECYNLRNWNCDFSRNGYRLPTEAEWEYAGRGGQYNPYYVFPWGNDSTNLSIANWPSSGDPYETGNYPWTTPVGFYNGQLKQKADFNWPGAQASYQTSNGANAYGLYDMAGNVWQFVNDWYGQNYYASSPYNNPTGPTSGFIMPDGKPYRGMRGGNWYNGQWGHSRVANRNPSYYRGPQDPNHPWYHVGFRIARKYISSTGVVNSQATAAPCSFNVTQNFPNPFNPSTQIRFSLSDAAYTIVAVYDCLGQEVRRIIAGTLTAGIHTVTFDAAGLSGGIYFCNVNSGQHSKTIKMTLIK